MICVAAALSFVIALVASAFARAHIAVAAQRVAANRALFIADAPLPRAKLLRAAASVEMDALARLDFADLPRQVDIAARS